MTKPSIKTNIKRLDKLKDKDIDYSDSPPLDDSFFEQVAVTLPK